MSQGERRLAAIMFTDMVGFTALTQSSESVAMEVLEKHNKLLRPFFPKFNGREVKAIGDSFLVEFDSALDALRCAVEIQSFLREYNSSTSAESKITLRIGVHLGDVIHRDGDVFGDAVNISSRIEPLAEPGGVCISRQVYDQVHNKFDLPFVSIGEKGLKNVKYPTEVYSVQMPWNQKLKADSPDAKRVAVLPFSNMSPDPADEYFADGMTEELISTVSRIEGTEVISRTSVMQYKKSPKPIREISRELEAGTVLEGSVRKAGNRLRVTVQMIDAGKDRHLWAESYDRNLDDVFAIQSDIAGRVATALKTRFASGTPDPASATRNLEAYTLFLRGSQLYHEDTVQSLKEAISCLEEAVRMDPGFSRSYSMLALALRSQAGDSGDYDAFMAKAEAAARRALELEPNGADAHVAMGAVHIGLDRFEDGRREMEAAIRINPNLSGAFLLLGEERGTIGSFDESISYFEKARALDPISFHPVNELAHTLRVSGRVGESIELLRGAKRRNPRNPWVYFDLSLCYFQAGDLNRGIQEVDEGLKVAPRNPYLRLMKGVWYGMREERENAESELRELTKEGDTVERNAQVMIRASLGDYDEAFDALMWLAEHHAWPFLTKWDPMIKLPRDDGRFVEFCRKVGLPP